MHFFKKYIIPYITSVSFAIIISGILISVSIFFTTWFFFGGYNNRTKIFLENPPRQVFMNPQQFIQNRPPQAQTINQMFPATTTTGTTQNPSLNSVINELGTSSKQINKPVKK